MTPWNAWYHITGNTYGTWLRGDPRGWKSRHHREHVEGDRRRPPPPAVYSKLHAQSQRLMKRPAIRLSPAARRVAYDCIVSVLAYHHADTVAVDDHHFHILVRFPDGRPRHWAGLAKKESARALSRTGMAEEGGVWAIRCQCTPIRDRAHQITVANYIIRHAERGAAIWTCKDPIPPLPRP